MSRLFDQHSIRKTHSLDGMWRFQTDPQDVGLAENWNASLPGTEQISVPSVWNTRLGLLEYEGAAWYEKRFYWDGGCLRLCFDAVMTEAEVWLDGQTLGYHYGGFCQFDFIVPDVAAGWHTLTVRADNRFDRNSIPQAKTDWFHYGGITRSVTAQKLEGICALYNRLEYTLSEDLSSAKCRLILELYNAQSSDCTTRLTASVGEQTVYSAALTLSAGEHKTLETPEFTLCALRLWDVGKPELYDITITTDTDDLLDKTGFRKVEIRDKKVYLNGKPLELLGVNRHEEHPDWGMAFPAGLMQRDLDIIEDLGCNTVRGSHYPNSQLFVDLLDSRGITFWSEIPMWGGGFNDDSLADPVVGARGLQMHREMVKYYYNHPCILIWGMHNEIDTTTQSALKLTEQYYGYLKEQGGNRLVVYATYRQLVDICMHLCDMICLNRYVGWYFGKREEWQKDMDEFRSRMEELGLTDKPVIYSEFGGAAIYGHHTFDDLRGTEEYQATLLEQCMTIFHQDPMVAGMYIWQFCDIRTCRAMGLDRSRTYNNKGILNEYRKPKLAYHTVKRLYHRFRGE